VRGYLPFAIDHFSQPSWQKIHDWREIFLSLKYVVGPNHFEIGEVFGMVMIAASELPYTVMMPDNQFYPTFFAEDVATDDSSRLFSANHGLLNPVGPP
jgi:hypothetical protein